MSYRRGGGGRQRDAIEPEVILKLRQRGVQVWQLHGVGIDAEMVKPSTPERGKRIGEALNALNMAVDQVRFFTLGVDFRRDKNPTFKRPGDPVGDRSPQP